MRKTLALLALAGLMALSVAAFDSPPTEKKETVKKNTSICTVKSADTSAVAARDAEARTVAETSNETFIAQAGTGVIAADPPTYTNANRYDVSPPERLQAGGTRRAADRLDFKYDWKAPAAIGYVPRL